MDNYNNCYICFDEKNITRCQCACVDTYAHVDCILSFFSANQKNNVFECPTCKMEYGGELREKIKHQQKINKQQKRVTAKKQRARQMYQQNANADDLVATSSRDDRSTLQEVIITFSDNLAPISPIRREDPSINRCKEIKLWLFIILIAIIIITPILGIIYALTRK